VSPETGEGPCLFLLGQGSIDVIALIDDPHVVRRILERWAAG